MAGNNQLPPGANGSGEKIWNYFGNNSRFSVLKESSCGNSSCTLCTVCMLLSWGVVGGSRLVFNKKQSQHPPNNHLPKRAPWGMVFPSRALIGRCALRSTRALERLVTATMPRRVTHAVPIVPCVLAREAGAWTEGTRRPTWLVPWLGWAQLEATKKVAMIFQGRQYSASWRARKNISKLVKLERKPLQKRSQDLTLAMSRSKGQHEMTWPYKTHLQTMKLYPSYHAVSRYSLELPTGISFKL